MGETPKRIVLVAYEGVQGLDVSGPAEVFSIANRLRPASYEIEIVASAPGVFCTSSGIRMCADRVFANFEGPVDTLLVAGGPGVDAAEDDAELIEWLRRWSPSVRRMGSVCTGAFLIAKAGILDGRSATTHWSHCADLAERYPRVDVQPDPIFVRDGTVYTSAGISAGMDLSLALLEADLGPEVAYQTARWLVLFLKRPGGQSQFSAGLSTSVPNSPGLRELQQWMVANVEADLSVPTLAARACMSPRHFARAFKRETGTTPGAHVEQLRLERARELLQSTALPLEAVTQHCGFGCVETLRRVFQRQLNVSPIEYRDRFSSTQGRPAAA